MINTGFCILTMVSAYWQWRMVAPKSVWLPLIWDMLLLPHKPSLYWWQIHLRLNLFINIFFLFFISVPASTA
jgi:hypothetical protein